MQRLLSVSVVVYRSDPDLLRATLESLGVALRRLVASATFGCPVVLLVDNGCPALERLCAADLFPLGVDVRILAGHGNVGFGAGHNLALKHANSLFHLILNPDVLLGPDSLVQAVAWMRGNPQCALLVPGVTGAAGSISRLCRRYPSVSTLLLRYMPRLASTKWGAGKIAAYEMAAMHESGEIYRNPDVASGCFMFFRSAVLHALGGFDERFFLYFEDYDLVIRTRALGDVWYVPSIEIRHFGGHAYRKSAWHVALFVYSAFKFYRKHGLRV